VVARAAAAGVDQNRELALGVVGFQRLRRVNVALGKGRVLQKLAVLVAVAARNGHRAVAFHHHDAGRVSIQAQPPDGAARDDEVRAGAELHVAVNALQHPTLVVDEQDFVGFRVLKVLLHRLLKYSSIGSAAWTWCQKQSWLPISGTRPETASPRAGKRLVFRCRWCRGSSISSLGAS